MVVKAAQRSVQVHKTTFWQRVVQQRALVYMLLPGMCFVLLFHYGPMYGLQIAFKDYSIGDGIWGSPYVGLKHFHAFFTNPASKAALRNTLIISAYKLVWGLPFPILLALALNEVDNMFFRRFVQTVSYLPHFISWIIISGLIINLLSPSTGIVNYFIKLFGGTPIYFMTNASYFRTILVASNIWKEVGWGTVVYLASISSIDAEQYEAAVVDGATRVQRIAYITFPSLLPLIATLLILSMGGIMSAGFDQIFNMTNPMVQNVSDIIDTFVYRVGLVQMSYSFSSAVGLFKSAVGMVLMIAVQTLARKMSGGTAGLW